MEENPIFVKRFEEIISKSTENHIKKIKHDRKLRAIIVNVNNNVADITLLDSSTDIYNVKIRDGLKLLPGDEVIVTVINNNLSNLIIDFRILDFNLLFGLDINRQYLIIDNFQNNTNWIEDGCTKSNDLIYYKYGNQGLKISTPDALGGDTSIYKTFSLDLTLFDSGDTSTDSDYIFNSFRIDNINALVTLNCIKIYYYTNTDYYYYYYNKSDLVSGWNNKSILKSNFSSSGTPDWGNITKIILTWDANIGYDGDFVTWGLISLVENFEKLKYIEMQPISSSDAPNISIFVDSSSGKVRFKDNTGVSYDLY